MASILLKNLCFLDFAGEKPFFHSSKDLIIENGKIIKISEPADLDTHDHPGEVIDCTKFAGIPGMINTHCHSPMVLFRGLGCDVIASDWFNKVIFPLESNLTPEDVFWGAKLALCEMIENGITCFADHYFFMEKIAQAVEESGIRAELAQCIFEHDGPKALDSALQFTLDYRTAAEGRVHTWLGPHSPYLCSPEYLQKIAGIGQKHGLSSHLHVSETKEQVQLSFAKYGKSPIRIVAESGLLEQPAIFAHCLYPQEDDFELLSGKKVGVAHAPVTYMSLAMGNVDLRKYAKIGIPLGLATDGAVSSQTLDLFSQMRATALSQKQYRDDATAMPLEELLCHTFKSAAELIRQPALGQIKEGAPADIVLLDQKASSQSPNNNPLANLVYMTQSRDVHTVICAGKIIYQAHEHKTLDAEKIKAEVNTRLERLKRVSSARRAHYEA
ncbi:MAG: amidohydrolase [Anaerolineaceae bacterium]|nr:amidohydrolase [Anaerolineaceae bacterium]